MTYQPPANLVELLDQVVGSAFQTNFYRSVLPSRPRIGSLDDFHRLPTTPIERLRAQRLADVVTDTKRVQWIAAAHRGQLPGEAAIAEGVDDTVTRYELFKDALSRALRGGRAGTGVVVSSSEKRYYAAEISTILGWTGIPTHVYTMDDSRVTHARLRQIGPGILVIVGCRVVESEMPSSIQLGVTFRGSQTLIRFPQLDMYVVDGLGFLAHSTDVRRWVPYNDEFYFERSDNGNLIVTSLRNRTQPMLRIETLDTADFLDVDTLKLRRLSLSG